MKKYFIGIAIIIYVLFPFMLRAQQGRDTVLDEMNLQQCIQFAVKHQPLVEQAIIDEQITETIIKSKLADWYPQINGNVNLLHYFQLPTAFFPDANGNKRPTKTGVINTSAIGIGASQYIFNRDLL